ncbi:signal peptidase II [Falcatimonas sp. MSJ-15]|uniref:signal peptidase II n=1 Tax=Falcatimonas sp. MSJ-15 TaxID=2841515 RepID=UPI001C1095B4|nr:signal peptidase II [Falcatimonas sp. MSJ-15]MBU5469179.1 signal peptidase II [Falcatimonas sp. MSJ-15]
MLYVLIIIAIVAGDWIIKAQMDKKLDFKSRIRILKNKITLNKLYNKGAMMSIFKDKPPVLYAASCGTLVFALYILCYLIKHRPKGNSVAVFLVKLGIALAIGGGLNNLIDRIKNGHVTDYFSINVSRPAFLKHIVFNLSDMFVFIGTTLAGISALFVN